MSVSFLSHFFKIPFCPQLPQKKILKISCKRYSCPLIIPKDIFPGSCDFFYCKMMVYEESGLLKMKQKWIIVM
jgi:hypothetical protein